MRRSRPFCSLLVLILLLALGIRSSAGPASTIAQAGADITAAPPTTRFAAVAPALAQSPVRFVENVGQFADGARFRVYGGGPALWLADDALWGTVAPSPPRPLSHPGERGKGRSPSPRDPPLQLCRRGGRG